MERNASKASNDMCILVSGRSLKTCWMEENKTKHKAAAEHARHQWSGLQCFPGDKYGGTSCPVNDSPALRDTVKVLGKGQGE
jgi:hypothetical protein